MSENAQPQFTTDDVIRRFIHNRDLIAGIESECKARVEALKDENKQFLAYIHKMLNESGEQSRGTESGIAFKKMVDFVKVKTWDAALGYIIEHEAWHLLKRDINKTGVKEYIEAHGVPPPGIEYTQVEEVSINKR